MEIISNFRQLLNVDILSLENMKKQLTDSFEKFDESQLQYDVARTKNKVKEPNLEQMKIKKENNKVN